MSLTVRSGGSEVVPEPESGPPTTLFRREVLEHQRNQWLGPLLLEPRVSGTMFTLFATAATLALVLFVAFGSFTRKERINGWLVPDLGMVRVAVPQPGVITEVLVREGSRVKEGEPLARLSIETETASFGTTGQEIVRRIAARRDSMAGQRAVQEAIFREKKQSLEERAALIRGERERLGSEIALQREALALAEANVAEIGRLAQEGWLPRRQSREAERDRIDQSAKLESLMRQRSALDRELSQIEAEAREVPLLAQSQIAEVDRNVATLEQQLAEAEARREIIIPAPRSGVVTSLQIASGGSADPKVPLMGIVPEGARLQAQLFSPSRAIGFVHEGLKVRLRYHAYPYQKFGVHDGVVASVSTAAISPAELPSQLGGLTSLFAANEPVYEITVDLARQDVTAYGRPVPLHAGMQVDADVVIETRSLIEWVFDPLYTITGR